MQPPYNEGMKFRYQRWMLRAALLYLLVGVSLGLFLYLAPAFPAFRWAFRWHTTHVHLLLMGTVIQVIMAVALWMFPRRKTPPYWTPEGQGMTLFWLFNLGVVLRSLAEPWALDHPGFYAVSLAGVVLEILALLYFVYLVHQRIRAPRGTSRPH